MSVTYISLQEAKDQLSIDYSNDTWDARLAMLIGACIDWAENYLNRSLGELLLLDSPRDSDAVPLPNPVDSPRGEDIRDRMRFWADGEWIDTTLWTPDQWRTYWQQNPVQEDHSSPLRRDLKAGILLYLETLFDRNPENMVLLEKRATDLIWPYRIDIGV
jgi:hypothetical protein